MAERTGDGTMRLTTAAALVRFLRAQYVARDGVEHRLVHAMFGIFGHGNVSGLGQALHEHAGGELPFLQGKNEQGMVHAAVAFAKTKRGLGTLACTSSVGPGATNLITGAAVATTNRLPVLLLPSDVFASRRPAPVLQQLEHPMSQDVSVNDCLRPVSRYWDRIQRPEQLLSALPEAMRVLSDPAERGAVTIALPEDVQTEAWAFPARFFAKRVYEQHREPAPMAAIDRAIAWLREARRPLIVAGGGVYYSEAGTALRALCEQTGIPVAVTHAGKGAIPDAHACALGALGVSGTTAANAIAHDADLVLCLGTRLSDFTTASKTAFQAEGVRFVSVNVDARDAHKHGALALRGDVRAVLEQLAPRLEGLRVEDAHARAVANAKAAWEGTYLDLVASSSASSSEAPLKQASAIRIVNERVSERATIVHAAGSLPGDLQKLWKSRTETDYHSEYAFSCMGYEIAGALGVKLADPTREVYALVGDGSYLMLSSELLTARQEGAKVTVILFDNHGYQCIHGLQRACGGASFGNELRRRGPDGTLSGEVLSVDFEKNAASLGLRTWRARTEDELAQALEAAERCAESALVHVLVDPLALVPGFGWWDVPVAEESEQPAVREAREEYERQRGRQKLHY
jgi:3D-(3,5/4)-trihydroxycyclohexane-1,2-dione acylhydrolase (decyclizing)